MAGNLFDQARELQISLSRAFYADGLNAPDWWSNDAERSEYNRLSERVGSVVYAAQHMDTCYYDLEAPNGHFLRERLMTDADRRRLHTATTTVLAQCHAAYDKWRVS